MRGTWGSGLVDPIKVWYLANLVGCSDLGEGEG